jgi:hypothetical protein
MKAGLSPAGEKRRNKTPASGKALAGVFTPGWETGWQGNAGRRRRRAAHNAAGSAAWASKPWGLSRALLHWIMYAIREESQISFHPQVHSPLVVNWAAPPDASSIGLRGPSPAGQARALSAPFADSARRLIAGRPKIPIAPFTRPPTGPRPYGAGPPAPAGRPRGRGGR